MKKSVSIVLADDHPIFLHGLRSILAAEDGLHIVGEAGNGEMALALIRDKKPKIAILDVEMPKMTGFQVAEKLFEESVPVSLIFLTMYRDEHMFNRALDIGVKGYVLKENAVLDIVNAVDAVLSGSYFISPLISDFLVNRSTKKEVSNADNPLNTLTTAERRILKLIARQKSNKEIAEELFLSTKTIENHRSSICKKLNLTGSFVLNKWVVQQIDQVNRLDV